MFTSFAIAKNQKDFPTFGFRLYRSTTMGIRRRGLDPLFAWFVDTP